MQFQSIRRSPLNLDIKFNNTKIEEVSSIKFLGIHLDANINWKIHVDKVCSKLSSYAYVLKRLREMASREVALSAYHGHVGSALQYGLLLWGNSADFDRAFRAQKRCIRSLCGAHFLDSCKPLFKKYNILPLPCLYIKQAAEFVKQHPELFRKNKEFLLIKLRDRSNNRLYNPKYNLKMTQNQAYYMSIKIFNNLPEDLKNLTGNLFNIKLKKWLMGRCYYSLNQFLQYRDFQL